MNCESLTGGLIGIVAGIALIGLYYLITDIISNRRIKNRDMRTVELPPETYTCDTCGIQSTPENRLQFITEIECQICWEKRTKMEPVVCINCSAEPSATRAFVSPYLCRHCWDLNGGR